MKNIILSVAIVFSILITSCQKTKISPNKINTQNSQIMTSEEQLKLTNDLQKVTDDFIFKQSTSANLKFNWGIVRADIEGGIGAGAGALIGGPGGAAIGAGIGAAGYSLAKAFGPNSSARINPNLGVVVNPNNAYEDVGVIHNLIINNVLTDTTLATVNGQFSLNKVYRYSVELINSLPNSNGNASTIYPIETFIADYNNIYLPNENSNFYQGTASMVENNRLTPFEKTIIDIYWTSVRAGNNLELFENYTVLFENIIIASTLNNISKSKLLSMLAVSRYSQAYWDR